MSARCFSLYGTLQDSGQQYICARWGDRGINALQALVGKKDILPKGDSIAELLPQLVSEAEFVFLDTYEAIQKTLRWAMGTPP